MRVILIDDEAPMQFILKEMLSKIPEVEIIGMFDNGRDALNFSMHNIIELAFVDISMPDVTGIEFARSIVSNNISMDIVFITAFEEYALEAFDVCALDYIVKPAMQNRLERTVSRAMTKYKMLHGANNGDIIKKSLNIYCLGSIDVRTWNNEKIKWISTKSEEVFFYLLFNKGRFVSRYTLVEEIFARMAPKNAEIYLNTAVYQLRKSLEPHGLKNTIISHTKGYSLEAENMNMDFISFEKRVKQQTCEINASNAVYAVETEKLYLGDLFKDKSYNWALPERARLFELYHRFAVRLVKWLLGTNDVDEALRILKKMIKWDELNEESNALMLQAYTARGDKGLMVKQYSKYTAALKKESGATPSRNIVNLYAELRSEFK